MGQCAFVACVVCFSMKAAGLIILKMCQPNEKIGIACRLLQNLQNASSPMRGYYKSHRSVDAYVGAGGALLPTRTQRRRRGKVTMVTAASFCRWKTKHTRTDFGAARYRSFSVSYSCSLYTHADTCLALTSKLSPRHTAYRVQRHFTVTRAACAILAVVLTRPTRDGS
jgi:hypothetical protein